MEGTIIRLLLFTSFVLAAILLLQSNFTAIADRAHATIRLAQDDSSNAQAAEPATSSDPASNDDSGRPAEGQE